MRALIWLAAILVMPCGAERLSFSEKLKSFKAEPEQSKLTADFEFVNKGDKPVKIVKWDGTCSCTSAQVKGGKLFYAPGEKGVIRTNLDFGNFSGVVQKSVLIWLDGDPENQASIHLIIEVDIPVLIEIEPKTLRWEINEVASPKSIKVTMNHDDPIKLLSATCNNEKFPVEIKTIEEGKEYVLTVTPQTTGEPGIGVLQIMTDCKVLKQASQRAFVVVRNPRVGEIVPDSPQKAIERQDGDPRKRR